MTRYRYSRRRPRTKRVNRSRRRQQKHRSTKRYSTTRKKQRRYKHTGGAGGNDKSRYALIVLIPKPTGILGRLRRGNPVYMKIHLNHLCKSDKEVGMFTKLTEGELEDTLLAPETAGLGWGALIIMQTERINNYVSAQKTTHPYQFFMQSIGEEIHAPCSTVHSKYMNFYQDPLLAEASTMRFINQSEFNKLKRNMKEPPDNTSQPGTPRKSRSRRPGVVVSSEYSPQKQNPGNPYGSGTPPYAY